MCCLPTPCWIWQHSVFCYLGLGKSEQYVPVFSISFHEAIPKSNKWSSGNSVCVFAVLNMKEVGDQSFSWCWLCNLLLFGCGAMQSGAGVYFSDGGNRSFWNAGMCLPLYLECNSFWSLTWIFKNISVCVCMCAHARARVHVRGDMCLHMYAQCKRVNKH